MKKANVVTVMTFAVAGLVIMAVALGGDDTPTAQQTADQANSTSQPTLRLVGIVNNENGFSAFAEDANAGRIVKLRVGDKVAQGRITRIDIDSVDYEVAGKANRVVIGQNFSGDECAITDVKASSYDSSLIGFSGKATKVVIVAITLDNKSDQPVKLSWKNAVPVLQITDRRVEAARILIPNWLPMAGGVGPYSTETLFNREQSTEFLEFDDGTRCGWLAIDNPGAQSGDHISIPVKSATLTVTKGKPTSIKLLFPEDIPLTSAELMLPGCEPSPFHLRASAGVATDTAAKTSESFSDLKHQPEGANVDAQNNLGVHPESQSAPATTNAKLTDVPDGYEIVEALMSKGKTPGEALDGALGKTASDKAVMGVMVRDDGGPMGVTVSEIEWQPKLVKADDKVRVFFPTLFHASGVVVKVYGKEVWKPPKNTGDAILSPEIVIPAKADEKGETPIMSICVGESGIRVQGVDAIKGGVTDIVILRKKPIK